MNDKQNLIYYQGGIPLIPQPTQENVNNITTPTVENKMNEIKNDERSIANNGRWEPKEHIRFLRGCLKYGNNWKKVETYVKSRTSTQIRSHAQKYFKKLEKKYCFQGLLENKLDSPNNSFSEESNNNKENNNAEKEDANNNSDKNKETNNKSESAKEEPKKKLTMDNNNHTVTGVQKEDFAAIDDKLKLDQEKINKLVEELPSSDFNIELVEKILLRKFNINKKNEEMQKNEINIKRTIHKPAALNKNNKNIFLCQKLKREINYESQVKDMLNSNDQSDLKKLFKIFEDYRDSIWYNTLMKQIMNN